MIQHIPYLCVLSIIRKISVINHVLESDNGCNKILNFLTIPFFNKMHQLMIINVNVRMPIIISLFHLSLNICLYISPQLISPIFCPIKFLSNNIIDSMCFRDRGIMRQMDNERMMHNPLRIVILFHNINFYLTLSSFLKYLLSYILSTNITLN